MVIQTQTLSSLVAKGFHLQEGVDFDDTNTLIVKPTTIRTILSLFVSYGWSLGQLNAKNVFLHGNLVETVYMTQSSGFIVPAHPTHVYHLQKAIYGLKQTPHV